MLEPDKCEAWHWKTWDAIEEFVTNAPGTVFLPIVNLVKDHKRPADLIGDGQNLGGGDNVG